ncbi:MAG: hypothetical protein HKN86_02530 [Acidimicrobiia bacterium]|nr:hypothetical protein [Acidimicrobiia bacterium]
MEMYANNRGNSPITHYELNSESITVWFKGGKSYSYSYSGDAGEYHVEAMKELALSGTGLSAYITQNVRFDYDK